MMFGVGLALLRTFNGSVFKLLKEYYPQHSWQEWRLEKVSSGWWRESKHRREFLEAIAQDSPEQLYSLSSPKLREFGGITL